MCLVDYMTSSALLEAIANVQYLDDTATNTAEALQYAQIMFSEDNGARSDVDHVTLIITDGESSDELATIDAAR